MDRFEERRKQLLEECQIDVEQLKGAWDRISQFLEPFLASLGTPKRIEFATQYVVGLTSDLQRKNIESIAYLHDQDRQPLQRFIGQMQWDHRPMLMELARQVGTTIGEADGVIVFDPSGHAKQGTHSVGVNRQWNGRHGKVENCQVGVYMGYASSQEHVLVNQRLYLPQDWTKDRSRLDACGVPCDVKFSTRLNLSLDMLDEQGPLLPHSWIAGDDEFGRSTQFRRDLRARNERYMLAVPSNTLVRDLEGGAASEWQDSGPPANPFVRVSALREALTDDDWVRVDVRDAEKGPLIVHVAIRRVLAITEKKNPSAEETLVIIRRGDENGKLVHDYYMSNGDRQTPAKEFARVATAQHRIEECIKRAKSEAGLSDYETRTWWGWHHHQTLSMMATWFLVLETRMGKKNHASSDRSTGPRSIGHDVARRNRVTRTRTNRAQLSATIGTKRTRTLLPPQKTQILATTTS